MIEKGKLFGFLPVTVTNTFTQVGPEVGTLKNGQFSFLLTAAIAIRSVTIAGGPVTDATCHPTTPTTLHLVSPRRWRVHCRRWCRYGQFRARAPGPVRAVDRFVESRPADRESRGDAYAERLVMAVQVNEPTARAMTSSEVSSAAVAWIPIRPSRGLEGAWCRSG